MGSTKKNRIKTTLRINQMDKIRKNKNSHGVERKINKEKMQQGEQLRDKVW